MLGRAKSIRGLVVVACIVLLAHINNVLFLYYLDPGWLQICIFYLTSMPMRVAAFMNVFDDHLFLLHLIACLVIEDQ